MYFQTSIYKEHIGIINFLLDKLFFTRWVSKSYFHLLILEAVHYHKKREKMQVVEDTITWEMQLCGSVRENANSATQGKFSMTWLAQMEKCEVENGKCSEKET